MKTFVGITNSGITEIFLLVRTRNNIKNVLLLLSSKDIQSKLSYELKTITYSDFTKYDNIP